MLKTNVEWRSDPTAPRIEAHLVNPRFQTGRAVCGKRPFDVWMIAEAWDKRCEMCQKHCKSNNEGKEG